MAMSDRMSGVAVVVSLHLAVKRIVNKYERRTHRGQTPATIHGAEHGTSADVERHVATHRASREGIARETTTAAKHVAVDVGIAVSADVGTGFNVHRDIAEHVAVLATAKRRTEDERIVADVDFGIFDIGPSVEHDTLVALACAKEVTGDRVVSDVLKRTRHSDGATRHIDGASAHHVGLLVAAIDVGEDMATGDVDHGIAPHTPCRAAPNRLGIIFVPERIIT